MKRAVYTSVLALASTLLSVAAPFAMGQDASQITIKDPAEYSAYTAAIGQADPKAKVAAIQQFLTTYPQTVVKADILEQEMTAYQQAGDADGILKAAGDLLKVDPNNLRALTFAAYILRTQASAKTNPAESQPLLDQASQYAQKGLAATKPAALAEADFQKLKTNANPIFHGAIAAAAFNRKDYATAITEFRAELQALPADQSTAGPALQDTFYLANAYLGQDPKDLVNAFYFFARAAGYAPEPYHTQFQTSAQYWYKKYHGGTDGYDDMAATAKANLFPPDTFKVTAAPPPPSPAELAAQLVSTTPDLNTLALTDKEYVLANGKTEDAEKVWALLKDKSTKVPGKVIVATADSVQLAVSDDSQQASKADFTVNFKTPLKDVPAVGATVEYVATFDSYTQTPPMIILKDGEVPAAKKPVPVHRPVRKNH